MKTKYLNSIIAASMLIGCTSETPEVPEQRKYTLEIVQDPNTEFNEELANKVKRLAELVITTRKGNYEEKVDEYDMHVRTRLEFGNKAYDIVVNDELKEPEVSIPEREVADLILIVEYSWAAEGERRALGFLDRGFDCQVNVGSMLVAYTDKLTPPENLIDYEFEKDDIKERKNFEKSWWGKTREGEEHKEYFNQEFERVVNELLECYEGE